MFINFILQETQNPAKTKKKANLTEAFPQPAPPGTLRTPQVWNKQTNTYLLHIPDLSSPDILLCFFLQRQFSTPDKGLVSQTGQVIVQVEHLSIFYNVIYTPMICTYG